MTQPAANPQLCIHNITHRFNESPPVLNDITLIVRPHNFISIIGPNGAGKSTLLKIAVGLLKPHRGTVTLSGASISQLSRREIAGTIGFLPQQYQLGDYLTAETVCALGRYSHSSGLGFLSAKDRDIIERCMAFTQCDLFRSRTLNQLSGGERQRVLLASVLSQEPQFLILDEPTAALDLHHQVSLFRLLKRLSDEGMGIVVVTHEINLSVLYCGYLILLHGGRFHSQGYAKDVITSETIASLFGDAAVIGEHPVSRMPIVLPAHESR